MLNKVIGNDEYKISLSSKVVKVATGEECTPHGNSKKIEVDIYGKRQSVDLKWLGLVSHFEVDLPPGLRKYLTRISFVSVNFLRFYPCGSIMTFSWPIEVTTGYRMVPGYTHLAANAYGNIHEITRDGTLGKELKPTVSKGYLVVNGYNPEFKKRKSLLVHRLVALAWCRNNDFANKFIVNHKDGNKLNPNYRNLEWCSFTENAVHAISVDLREDNINCRVRDVKTGEITNYHSIGSMFDAIGAKRVTVNELEKAKKGHLLKKRYEVRLDGDDTPWFYEENKIQKRAGRYIITITNPQGEVKKFYDVRDVVREYKLWNMSWSVEMIQREIPKRLPGSTVDIEDTMTLSEIEAYQVDTGKITTYESMRDASRKIGIQFSSIRTCVRTSETKVIQGYAFRSKSDKPWNTNFTIPVEPKCILATNEETKETIKFKSMREAAKYLKVDRSVIKHRLENDKKFGNWNFNYI